MVLLAAFFTGLPTLAQLKIPAVFSDNMVLQRDQRVAVWGWADPGVEVTVAFAGHTQRARAGADGKFSLALPALTASSEPRSMTFTAASGGRAEVKNILVGEVWLCSGQSNMQMSVSRAKNFEKEQGDAVNYPQIRMFLTDLQSAIKPQADCNGSWQLCAPQTVGAFSATAYFFGRTLHQELGVPIGLIRSAWGGTGIESWSPMDSLTKFPSVMESKAAMDRKAAAFDEAGAERDYAAKMAAWNEKVKAARAAGKNPPRRPGKAISPHADQNYPANLYNAMIHPLVPYGIRGAIWYQGERNAHSLEGAALYRDLLENLVVQWRGAWNTELPFYAVQLVNFKAPQVEPVENTGWAVIRESFLKFHREVPGCGIAVGIDVGEESDIHPKDKQSIGLRLAQQALVRTYGKPGVPGGPVYKGMQAEGSRIILHFDDIGSGLDARGGELKRFAIAGVDRKFVDARAEIRGDTVVVSSPDVVQPAAVRYAWADNPTGCNLYNKEGFPASPFRTDNWPFAE